MTAQFWIGLAALPAATLIGLGTFYVAIKAWDVLAELVGRMKPRRLPAPTEVVDVNKGARRFLRHRDRARIAAGIVYDPTAFFFQPLPGVSVVISRDYRSDDDLTRRAKLLNRRFREAIEDIDRELPQEVNR